MKRVNLKELSKMLSLNPSTVSRALSDHPDISNTTKKKVQDAAEAFGYSPNLHAKYFRKKSSGLIAIILPDFNMFFTPDLLRGITSVLQDSGFSIITFYSNNDKKREEEIALHCLSWVVDGILMSVASNTENIDHLLLLLDAEIPIVMLDRVLYNQKISTVTIDDEMVAYQATNLLLEKGKNNILGIFGNPNLEITKQRVQGFHRALEDNKSAAIQKKIYYQIAQKDDALTDVIEENMDAVFTMSDETLINVYYLLKEKNLYPDKISIVSISDGKIPQFLFPKITHIHHSGFEVGKRAAEVLLYHKTNPNQSAENILVETEMVYLDSIR